MPHIVIAGALVAPPAPAEALVHNYLDEPDAVPHLAHRRRTAPWRNLVLHETAGRTARGAVKTLQAKRNGVHLVLDRDGALYCHGDLLWDRMPHCGALNDVSVGIEIVNPYAPGLAGDLPIEIIPATWWTWCRNGDRHYVLPTAAQLAVLRVLTPWLCAQTGIPWAFPTADLGPRQPKIPGWNSRPPARPDPGVVAHRDFGVHADGRYPLQFLMQGVSVEKD